MTTSRFKLSEVCFINPSTSNGLKDEDEVTFIPMASVDEVEGRVRTPLVRNYSEVKKGFTSFLENDILFAKITPCMENGKCAVVTETKNGYGFGSTEFHVIRPKEDALISWVYYFLRQQKVRDQAEQSMTGSAGQKRVPKSFFDTIKIPLPDLKTQQKIAATLEQADSARQKRKQANQLTEQFLQSAFLEMFGDPVRNEKGWEMILFSEVGKLDRGRSKHRPRNAPHLLGGKYPLIQTGEVANCNGYIREYTHTYSDAGLKQSKMWKKGTLLITIAANIAKTGVLTFDACFPDSIVGFVPNQKTCVEFIQCWLSFLQETLEANAPESAQKNINLEILRSLQLPLPPIIFQKKFASLVTEIEKLRSKQRESERELENLFQSLMQRYFG